MSDPSTDESYTTRQINKAVRAAEFDSLRVCVAELSTKGFTLTKIAKQLGLNPRRFSAYYYQWCRDHAEALRLSEEIE
jgi:hypothetical protein